MAFDTLFHVELQSLDVQPLIERCLHQTGMLNLECITSKVDLTVQL